jgi:hypothetical protein
MVYRHPLRQEAPGAAGRPQPRRGPPPVRRRHHPARPAALADRLRRWPAAVRGDPPAGRGHRRPAHGAARPRRQGPQGPAGAAVAAAAGAVARLLAAVHPLRQRLDRSAPGADRPRFAIGSLPLASWGTVR